MNIAPATASDDQHAIPIDSDLHTALRAGTDQRVDMKLNPLLYLTHRCPSEGWPLTEAGIQVLPIMVALGNWGLAYRDGSQRLRVRAELLRDGGPELVTGMMDELRELHLGIPRPDPTAPRPSEQLQAAYDNAMCVNVAS